MIASEPKMFAFSRLKFVGKSHYLSGQFRAPPPQSGYTIVGLMQSDNLFAREARGENGKWMHKLVIKR